jgi:adenosine deaminase
MAVKRSRRERISDLEALRRCPKSDLHNHAFCGGDRDFLHNRTGREIATLDRKLKSIGEMQAWVEANIGDLLSNGAGRLIAFEAAFVQPKRDGVKRLEIDIAASTACSLRFWARYNPDRFI